MWIEFDGQHHPEPAYVDNSGAGDNSSPHYPDDGTSIWWGRVLTPRLLAGWAQH